MDEPTGIIEETSKSKCTLCGKETALALFGVLLGLVFIGISVDIIRRNRMLKGEETHD